MKRIFSVLLAAVLLTAMSVSAAPLRFSDVNEDDWYYASITSMTGKGYFTGKGDIIDGVGVFAPNDTMTKAEFLTVVARILFDESKLEHSEGEAWWEPYYNALLKNEVITQQDISKPNITQPMTREEMALVAINTMEYRNESFSDVNKEKVETAIPDILMVDVNYKNSVIMAYGKGILVGTDDYGTYSPKGSLTRAAATTVLYRIIDATQREKVNFDKADEGGNTTGFAAIDPDTGKAVPSELRNSDDTASIMIYEGVPRENRPAKEGDTFIKADGTRVVIKKDKYGIVGGGQGIRPDVSLHYNSIDGYCRVSAVFSYGGSKLGGEYDGLYWTDSTGTEIRGSKYCVNKTTGEAHWEGEWNALGKAIPAPEHQGSEGEVSQDDYHLYVWSVQDGRWELNII